MGLERLTVNLTCTQVLEPNALFLIKIGYNHGCPWPRWNWLPESKVPWLIILINICITSIALFSVCTTTLLPDSGITGWTSYGHICTTCNQPKHCPEDHHWMSLQNTFLCSNIIFGSPVKRTSCLTWQRLTQSVTTILLYCLIHFSTSLMKNTIYLLSQIFSTCKSLHHCTCQDIIFCTSLGTHEDPRTLPLWLWTQDILILKKLILNKIRVRKNWSTDNSKKFGSFHAMFVTLRITHTHSKIHCCATAWIVTQLLHFFKGGDEKFAETLLQKY